MAVAGRGEIRKIKQSLLLGQRSPPSVIECKDTLSWLIRKTHHATLCEWILLLPLWRK